MPSQAVAERKARHDAPWLPSGRSTNAPPLAAIQARLKAIEDEVARRSGPDRLRASIPPKFAPVMAPARYKGMKGGRGSAKSQTAARLLLLEHYDNPGMRSVCVREIQLSLEQSVKRLLKDLIDEFRLDDHGFEVRESRIDTPGGGVIVFMGMQNHTAKSIKSLEGFDRAWVEEANTLSATSLELLRPTIRKPGSELWFTWNPERPTDPVDKLFASGDRPDGAVLVEANHGDNPHFPEELRKEMARDYRVDAELAAHIWGGKYRRKSAATVFKNVRVEDYETPADAQFLFGSDFGYAADPAALVRCWIPERHHWEGEHGRPPCVRPRDLELAAEGRVLCIDRAVMKVGVEIDDLPEFFDSLDPSRPGMARAWQIKADSARPDTISYVRRHGYGRIEAAKKGPNSVIEGVKFLQGFEIIIHTSATAAIDEFLDYSFKTHRLTGEVLPELVDKKNHVIDSTRYALEDVMDGGGGVTW